MATPISDASGFYNYLMNVPNQNGSFILENDINMTGYSLKSKPIDGFRGILDGNNKILTIDISNIIPNYNGLFRFIQNPGSVKKLTVNYISSIQSTPFNLITASDVINTGLLSGSCEAGSTINNVTVNFNADISGGTIQIYNNSSNSIETSVGGLFGRCIGSTISNCSLNFKKDIIYDILSNGSVYYGGLAGFNKDCSDISGCSVKFRNTNIRIRCPSGNIISGGLIGYNYSINNSSNVKNNTIDYSGNLIINSFIITSQSTNINIGTLFGLNKGQSIISDCSGTIHGTTTLIGTHNGLNGNVRLGGLISENNNVLSTNNIITYNNTLDIIGNAPVGSIIIGGLIARISSGANISGCSGSFRNTNITVRSDLGGAISSGLAGNITDSNTRVTNLFVDYSGNLIINNSINNNSQNFLLSGGLFGINQNFAQIYDCSGIIHGITRIISKHNGNNDCAIGGLIALDISGALVSNCNVTYNDIFDISGNTNSGQAGIGGLVGAIFNGSDISGCSGTFINTNINLNSTSGNSTIGGLIGYIRDSNSIIKKSYVNYSGNLFINGTITSGLNNLAVSGLFGANQESGIIQDCFGNINGITTLISNNNGSGNNYIGGLIGVNNSGNSSIRNCRITYNNQLDISGTSVSGRLFAGGLIGSNNTIANISGCSGYFKNTNITIKGLLENIYSGGLAADIKGINTSITNTFVDYSGNLIINGDTSGSSILSIGGLFGGNFDGARLLDCSGNIRGTTQLIGKTINGNNNIGGLIGVNNTSGSLVEQTNIIYNNTLNISGLSTSGFVLIGGLIGNNTATGDISECSGSFKTTNISGITNGGRVSIGGLAGINDTNNIVGTTRISKCSVDYNGNNLNITDILGQFSFIGGLIGFNRNGAILRDICGNIGNININNSNSLLNNNIGGLIGRNQASSLENSSIIADKFIVNNVDGKDSSNPNANLDIGGLIGNNLNGNIINNISGNINTISISKIKNYLGCNIAGLCSSNQNIGVSSTQLTNCYINNTNLLCDISNNQISEINFGGLFGNILNTVNTTNTDIISNCSGSFSNIITKLNGTKSVAIGSLAGFISDISGSSVNIKFTNNAINIGPNSIFESTNDASGVYIGGIIGQTENQSDISGNSVIYGDKLTFKAKQLPPSSTKVLKLNSDFGDISGTPTTRVNNTVTFVDKPLEFTSNGNTAQSITFNNTVYPVPETGTTIIKGNGFNIDLSDITMYIYLFNEPIPIPPQILVQIPPCCIANTLVPNPQVTDYDSSVKESNTNNSAIVKSVDQFYTAVATRVRTAYSQPVFSSYQAYIQYLQGKNKR